MYSRNHAALSAALGVGILLVAPPRAHPIALVAYVVAVGVGIDFDHFVVARFNTGSWKNARRVLRSPERAFVDQESIFDVGDLWPEQRLFSHLLLGGVAVAGLWPVSPYWAGVTAAALYVHLLADVYADLRKREEHVEEAARELRSA